MNKPCICDERYNDECENAKCLATRKRDEAYFRAAYERERAARANEELCDRCEEPSDELNDRGICPKCVENRIAMMIDDACDRLKYGESA